MTRILDTLREPLKLLMRSHAQLSYEEYKRNLSYNNNHYSVIAEQAMLDWFMKNDEAFLTECFGDKK